MDFACYETMREECFGYHNQSESDYRNSGVLETKERNREKRLRFEIYSECHKTSFRHSIPLYSNNSQTEKTAKEFSVDISFPKNKHPQSVEVEIHKSDSSCLEDAKKTNDRNHCLQSLLTSFDNEIDENYIPPLLTKAIPDLHEEVRDDIDYASRSEGERDGNSREQAVREEEFFSPPYALSTDTITPLVMKHETIQKGRTIKQKSFFDNYPSAFKSDSAFIRQNIRNHYDCYESYI